MDLSSPRRTGEILQERQPLSTDVYKAERATSLENISKVLQKKEARDPDPDVEARQFYSILGGYIYRDHVAPRTKLYVPKDDFPIPLNYIDVQRETKSSTDVLHEATIYD